MEEGAWYAEAHGFAKSQTWLSGFTFTFHFHTLEKEMTTHSCVLAWRIPGTGEPGGLQSMVSHRVRHDWSESAAAAAAAVALLYISLRFNLNFLIKKKYAVKVGHSFSPKEQASFMAAVTICSDFGAQSNKVYHCFHHFPIYLAWSDEIGCHDLSFLIFIYFLFIYFLSFFNVEF